MPGNSLEKNQVQKRRKSDRTTSMEIFFSSFSTVFANVNVLDGPGFYLEIAKLLFSMVSNLIAGSKPTRRYLLLSLLSTLVRFYVPGDNN